MLSGILPHAPQAAPRGLAGRVVPPAVVFVAVAAALEALVRLNDIPNYLLPRPSAVLATLANDRIVLLAALWTTAQAALLGFLASAFVGTLLAIGLAASRLARRAFYPYTVFFQTVPVVAIAPLLVIWLDPGLTAVATCAFVVSVFPVIANALAGLRSTDPALVDLFRLYGATPTASIVKLRLPAALPHLITGLRVAAGLAVIGTVVAEFLVGLLGDNEGLGVMMVAARKEGRTDRVFAGVLITSLLGLALFGMVNGVGRAMLHKWHASERE